MRNSLLALSLLAAACSQSADPAAGAAAPPTAEGAPAAAGSPHGGQAHPGVNHPASTSLPPPAAPTAAPVAGGLTWDGAAPLVRQAPRSSMRAAQYTVDGEPRAELGVFYFGEGQGGSVEDNVTRWLGQLKQSDGSDTVAKAKRSEREVGGLKVALVEAEGLYSGGMGMPGAPAPEPIADALLLGAIAQGPKGPVFFKLTGPKEAIERARPAFDAMIASIRPAS